MNKRIEELNELKYNLNYEDPFMYVFSSLIGINFKTYPKPYTAHLIKIGNFINIEIDPNFWDSLKNNKEKLFLIKHELYHLIFKHITQVFLNYNSEIFGIAADFYINYILSSDNSVNLIPGAFHYLDPAFKDLNLTENIVKEGTLNIYNHLLNYKKECEKFKIDNHNWESFKEVRIIDAKIDNDILQSEKISGKVPSSITTIIKNLKSKYNKEINYKTILKKIVNNLGSKVYLKRSGLKEHNFYPDSDGTRIKYKGTIPIIVDTSGSMMNTNDISDVCDQLITIAKQSNLMLKIIECDAAVSKESIWIYKSKKDLNNRLKNGFIGGGGTEVDPAINYINKNIRDVKIAIYITDGCVSPPSVNHNYKLIVILTRSSKKTIKEISETWRNNKYTILKIKN